MIPVTESLLKQQEPSLLEGLRRKARTLMQACPLDFSLLSPEDTLFISIDVNNGFAVSGALQSIEAAALVRPSATLMERARKAGFETLAFCDRHTERSPELAFFPAHCVDGTGEDQLPTVLQAQIGKILYKNSTNGFFAPGAQEEAFRFRRFVVTGCLTDLCVYQYAVTLRAWLNEQNRADCEVIVPLDLIDTYDAPDHSALLHNIIYASGLAECGVRLVSTIQ